MEVPASGAVLAEAPAHRATGERIHRAGGAVAAGDGELSELALDDLHDPVGHDLGREQLALVAELLVERPDLRVDRPGAHDADVDAGAVEVDRQSVRPT